MAWNGQDFDFFVHFWFDNRMFLLKVILIIILKSLKASQTCRIWFWPDRNRYSWSWRLDFARFFIKSSLTLSHSNFYNSEVRNFPLIEFYKISKNSPEWPFLAFSKNNFNFIAFLLSAKKTICLFRAVLFIHRMCDQKRPSRGVFRYFE